MMSRSILLVDDDPDILFTLGMVLKTEGYTVYTEENIEKAKEIVTEQRVQLVIIDYVLPDLFGDKVAGILKNVDERLQFIFLSGYSAVYEAVENLKFSVLRVFLKPVDIEALLSAIKNMYAKGNDHYQLQNPYTNLVFR